MSDRWASTHHAISDEEKNVLGFADLIDIADQPVCSCVRAIVGQNGFILTRLVERNSAVCFGSYVDDGRSFGISRK